MNRLQKTLLLGSGAIAALMLGGCVVSGTVVHEDRPRYYDDRPRPVVVEQPQPVYVAPAPQPEVVVYQPVPTAVVERRPPAPGPEVVWIDGFYEPGAGGRGWVWHPGHYERPPHPGAVWVAPRHEVRGSGEVHFSMGFWR